MDTIEAPNEFQDWEVLNSDSDPESDPVKSSESVYSMDEIDSAGSIQVNYFSIEAQNQRHVEELDDNKSLESENPSWIDPGLEENPTRFLNKDPCEFWSDSSSERSEDQKFNYLAGSNEMASYGKGKSEVGSEGTGEIVEQKGEKMEDVGKFYSDYSGIEVCSANSNDHVQSREVGAEGNMNLHHESEVSAIEKSENEKFGNKKSGEIERRGMVWWKMPMEFLRYCLFRMSPAWTVSMAAAVMGFMLLGRRLYKMKKKSRGLQIKVTVDDKKVSQVMSRAARLNEAFTIVKRVPVIRPSFPALGTTSWPVMTSLR